MDESFWIRHNVAFAGSFGLDCYLHGDEICSIQGIVHHPWAP